MQDKNERRPALNVWAKWLARYYRRYPHVVVILIVLTPVEAFLTALVPRLVGFTIDYLKTGEVPANRLAREVVSRWGALGLSPPVAFAATFILFGLVSFAIYAYFQGWRAWMNTRLEWDFRQEAFDRMTVKGPDFFTRYRTGDLVTRMTDDVAEKLSWFACSGIFRFYEALLGIGFIVVMMIGIDPGLTLWTAGPLPVLILVFFKSSSMLDTRYDRLQRRISSVNDLLEACFSGIRIVKSYVREDAQKREFDRVARERRRAEIASIRATAVIDSLYGSIWQFGVVIVLFAGGYKVVSGGLTVGGLAAFIYYVVWLIFPMFDVGQYLVKSRQSAVSIKRLMEMEKVLPMVLDRGERRGNGDFRGDVRFEGVSFAFAGAKRKILDGVALEVGAGETVAVVGRVGSGKSWLVNMIPRLVDPTGGRISVSGHDLREYPLEELRRHVGYVPQDPALFSDTVRSNIVFGREGIDDERIAWAVEVAQFREEVDAFPDRLETQIGTRGMSISGGQKQRLALARALAGRPEILILDDCTSALDARTEAALWERLHEVMPEMTSVLITHRPDTLRRADRIYVLGEGRLVEQGSHGELIARRGEYARIYRRYEMEAEIRP